MTDETQKSSRGTLSLKGAAANPNPGSAETVTVGCKLPSGLKMRIFHEVTRDIPVMGGGVKEAKEFEPIPNAPSYTLNGFSHEQKTAPEHAIIGGAALTHGIPKDFWDAWYKQNRNSDLVRNGLIFAHVSESEARAEAKDKVSLKSGLERLDPDNLPPQFKNIKTDDKKAA